MSKLFVCSCMWFLLAACGDGGGSAPGGTGGSSGSGGTGGTGGTGGNEPECFENPQTHHEIINACTNSVKVEKHPDLKLLNPDGTLPEP